jgi:hypothetical protein
MPRGAYNLPKQKRSTPSQGLDRSKKSVNSDNMTQLTAIRQASSPYPRFWVHEADQIELMKVEAHRVRGLDLDRQGLVWAALIHSLYDQRKKLLGVLSEEVADQHQILSYGKHLVPEGESSDYAWDAAIQQLYTYHLEQGRRIHVDPQVVRNRVLGRMEHVYRTRTA